MTIKYGGGIAGKVLRLCYVDVLSRLTVAGDLDWSGECVRVVTTAFLHVYIPKLSPRRAHVALSNRTVSQNEK